MSESLPINLAMQQLLLPDDLTVRVLRMIANGLNREQIREYLRAHPAVEQLDNALALLVAEQYVQMTVPADAIQMVLTGRGRHVLDAIDQTNETP